MKRIALLSVLTLCASVLFAQTNIHSTNPAALTAMKGLHDPTAYAAPVVIDHPTQIIPMLNSGVNADTLKRYMEILQTFENRNTGSDTISLTRGIGAARKWVYSKFEEISLANNNRLIPSYLQFDLAICGMSRHKNIFGVLPGRDTSLKDIIIVEGHIDSRCQGLCDTVCQAHGMEDNATGTALVIELARVMSKFTFDRTIVFLVVIGEEQGLYGADAFGDYVGTEGIKLRGVLNNDVIGGVICGKTSSAPSCPGENTIDSTQVRLFSFGGFNSFQKSLARFSKLEYKENLLPIVSVPMALTIMSAEDRTGRGGDHQPFRMKGHAAIRFTSAHEHGNASNSPGYTDRQHTDRDILGVDTDSNSVIDSFFVDFNYLARNTVINSNAIATMAMGAQTPTFTAALVSGGIETTITSPVPYNFYRIGLRTTTNDFDTVYTTSKLVDTLMLSGGTYNVSVASVDSNGIESLFSREYALTVVATGLVEKMKAKAPVELLQNRPNPADEATIIGVRINQPFGCKDAHIEIADLTGKIIKKIPLELQGETTEVLYEHGYGVTGIYIYSLVIDGKVVQSKKMQFSN